MGGLTKNSLWGINIRVNLRGLLARRRRRFLKFGPILKNWGNWGYPRSRDSNPTSNGASLNRSIFKGGFPTIFLMVTVPWTAAVAKFFYINRFLFLYLYEILGEICLHFSVFYTFFNFFVSIILIFKIERLLAKSPFLGRNPLNMKKLAAQ